MSGRKRALEEVDSNVVSTASSKRAKEVTGSHRPNDTGDGDEVSVAEISTRLPYEYICIDKEWYMCDKSKEEKTNMCNKLAVDHPEWQYTTMVESRKRLRDHVRLVTLTDTNAVDVRTHHIYHLHGLVELLENLLIDFNTARRKKDLNEMWSIIATIAHWLNHPEASWFHIKDGRESDRLFELTGAALLTALEEIDRVGQLTSDSKYRDLGLITALFLLWSIIPARIPMMGLDVFWRPNLIAYAKKANIDLGEQGVDKLISCRA